MQIWDIYLRIFHWALAVSMIVAIISAEESTQVHVISAQVISTLAIFRVIWGIIGTKTARFSQFFPTPSRLKNYMSGGFAGVGHNPLGALSIFAMLGLILLQLATGLFTTDEILFEAPWYSLVGAEVQEILQQVHHIVGSLLQLLIILHITAIVIYKLRGKNLIQDMITGGKTTSDLGVKYIHLRALFALSVGASVTYFIFY